jgi:hypothetical protein
MSLSSDSSSSYWASGGRWPGASPRATTALTSASVALMRRTISWLLTFWKVKTLSSSLSSSLTKRSSSSSDQVACEVGVSAFLSCSYSMYCHCQSGRLEDARWTPNLGALGVSQESSSARHWLVSKSEHVPHCGIGDGLRSQLYREGNVGRAHVKDSGARSATFALGSVKRLSLCAGMGDSSLDSANNRESLAAASG